MAAEKKTKDSVWYIHCIITVCIMAFWRFLPAPDPITPMGWATVGIFFGCIYGWLTTSFIWVGITGLIFYGFAAGNGPVAAWGAMMSNQNVALAIWLMISCCLLTDSGVADWLAQWSVTRKSTKGRPWRLWLMVMIATMVCGMILGMVPAIIVFFAIVKPICEGVGYKAGSTTGAFFILTVVVYSCTSAITMPFHLSVVMNYSMLAAGSGGVFNGTFNYGLYMFYSVTVNIVALIGGYLLGRFVFKVDMDLFRDYDPESHTLNPLSQRQKISVGMFGVMFVLLMLQGALPGEGIPLLTKAGTAGIIMALMAFCLVVRYKGEPLIKFETAFNNNVMWGPLFLFGTALTLAASINSADAGVGAFLKGAIGPMLTAMPPLMFVICYMLIALLLTNLVNNAVVTAIMVPMSWSLCMTVGVNPLALLACFILFVDYAILLPSASPAAALMYSSGGWIDRAQIFKFGIPTIIMLVVISFVVGWPLANVVFAPAFAALGL